MESITLIDGTVLPVTLKPEQPAQVVPDGLAIDTTGKFLSYDGVPRPAQADVSAEALRKYYHRLFVENAWTLFNNAGRIMSDSRMFLAPVHIDNHLAYTGTSGFTNPTAGVYVEWWTNNMDCAIDRDGNLVWYIAGSPLSGANACMAVDRDNRSVKMSQEKISFRSVWQSFMEENQRYTEAKQRCEAYSFEDLLALLRGESYRIYMGGLLQEAFDGTALHDSKPKTAGFVD